MKLKGPFYDGKPNSPADAFAHHGVKGMKWGVRKDQSTSGRTSGSVDSATMAKREKKAQFHDGQAKKAQVMIDTIKANPSKYKFVQNSRDNQTRKLEEFRKEHVQAAKDVRAGKLTSRQKKVLIGVGIIGGIVVLKAGSQYFDSGQQHALAIRGKEFATGKTHAWKRRESLTNPRMDVSAIQRQVVDPINSEFGAPGTKMNCRRCTFAYEMRRRGNDVMATRSRKATGQNALGVENAITPGLHLPSVTNTGILTRLNKEKGSGQVTSILANNQWGKNKIGDGTSYRDLPADMKSNSIFKHLSTQPNGARGELGVGWSSGGGHSMAWEVVHGKPVIFDCQTGERYIHARAFDDFAENVNAAAFTRLDNVKLNDAFLRRWVQDA